MEETKKNVKPKPFLKRKTKTVKFKKVDWKNVKSRTDCWSKPSGRSETREKSIPSKTKRESAKSKPDSKPKVKKMKGMTNVQSRIDTGIRKDNRRQFGSEDSDESFEYERYNVHQYSQRNRHDSRGRHQPDYPPKIDVKRFYLEKQRAMENQNVSNPQYEVYSSGEDQVPVHEPEEFEYNEMYNDYAENPMTQQHMVEYNQPQYDGPEEVEMEMGKLSY